MEKKTAIARKGKDRSAADSVSVFLLANGITVDAVKENIAFDRRWLEKVEPLVVKAATAAAYKPILRHLIRFRGSMRRNIQRHEKLLKMLEG